MGATIARILELIPATFRQAIPLNGIFAEGWQPATAVALYWFESVLLMVIAVVLCWRIRRRTSDDAIAFARESGDSDAAEALAAEQLAARKAGVNPQDVLLFHGGSLGVFGGFLGGVLFILTANGHIGPFNWEQFRDGADAMMLVVAVSFGLEMLSFRAMNVAAVQSRVDACLGRWALLWLLGFFGTIALAATGRVGAFFGWFAILKAAWEGWGMLARVFGWKSLNDRTAQSPSQSQAGSQS